MPVPKPRHQPSLSNVDKTSEISSQEDHSVQEFSLTSSSAAQFEAKKHDLSQLDDESFPSEAKVTDSDDEFDHKSEKSRSSDSKYKIKEREDILDLDDDDAIAAQVEKMDTEKVAIEHEVDNLSEDTESNRNLASFYIGESTSNIITKSSNDMRQDESLESTQASLRDDFSKDISDEVSSKSMTQETDIDSSYSKVHEFLQAEREAYDQTKIEKNEIEATEKETIPFLQAEKAPEVSKRESISLMPTDVVGEDYDPIVSSPSVSIKSDRIERANLQDVQQLESFDWAQYKTLESGDEPIVSYPKSGSIESDRSYDQRQKDFDEVITEARRQSISEEAELENVETKTRPNVVHSPVECKINTVTFDDQPTLIPEKLSELQRASEIHSPAQSATEVRTTHVKTILDQNDEKFEHEIDVERMRASITSKDSEESGYFYEVTAAPKQESQPLVEQMAKMTKVVELESISKDEIKQFEDIVHGEKVQEIEKSDRTASPQIDFESDKEELLSPRQSSDGSSNKLEVVHRAKSAKPTPATRWSVTDPDNYSSPGSRCESVDNSRPCSSDVENLCPSSFANSSADYQTAQDISYHPGSTEYHTAASTFDHSGKTISSQESMKSFDSMSSKEISEASETLVPSTSDMDLPIDTQTTKDFELVEELDDDEQRLASLEACSGILLDDGAEAEAEIESVSAQMKRSHEMIFRADSVPAETEDTPEVTERRKSDDELKSGVMSLDESRFATSLEEGSILSVSLSSTDNVETIVENRADSLSGSLGSSLIGSYEAQSLLKDDMMTGTSFDEGRGIDDDFDNLIMTTSIVQEQNVTSANTQITTSNDALESLRRGKGHKRNDSTSFVKFPIEEAAIGEAEKFPLEEKEETQQLIDEMIVHEIPREEPKESDTDSDDCYKTEYSRSFRQPTKQRKKKSFNEKTIEKPEIDLERKKSVPSIETIVEDVIAEVDLEQETEHVVSQNMMDFSKIPDIMITESKAPVESPDDVCKDVVHDESKSEAVQEVEKKTEKVDDEIVVYVEKKEKVKPLRISEKEKEQLIEQQFQVAVKANEELKSDSPTSDSFEMLDQPDETDEFVIIEEVAKEASEMMSEGKSVSIKPMKYEKKHDDEVERILVKSAPAATNEGSTLLQGHHDLAFELEDSPPSGGNATGSSDDGGSGNESSRKWVEMQLAEQAQNMRYPYEMDRGILEDIKEEDTDFEIGSSRISSFKDSFSSSDFEAIAAKRYANKEHDAISMNSLQEFESLEQAISLENRRFHQGSQDSSSNGSFPKRFSGRSAQAEEVSLASLKEFEGLENACMEVTLLEMKAKDEHALLLSRSDESNKSNKSDKAPTGTGTHSEVTVTAITTTAVTTEFQPKDEEKRQLSTTRPLTAQLKEESHHDSNDSLEISKSGTDVMTSSVDSIEVSKDGAQIMRSSKSDADSIELGGSQRDSKRDSIDSIEMQESLITSQRSIMQRDSIDGGKTIVEVTTTSVSGDNQTIETRTITATTTTSASSGYGGGISKDISSDSLNIQHSEPELLLTSTESLDHMTSSTNATYHNANDSQMTMSGSMTSCDSNTLVDSIHSESIKYGGNTTITTVASEFYRSTGDSDNRNDVEAWLKFEKGIFFFY